MNKNAIKVLIYAYLSRLFKMTNSRVLGNIFGPQIRAWGTLMHFFQLWALAAQILINRTGVAGAVINGAYPV